MKKPRISIIVAMDEQRGIGKKNGLMWNIPGELARFKKITVPHPIIMGRKTHESIGRPLPNRLNIVITRDQNFAADGVTLCHSLDEAVEIAKKHDQEEIFIIGGGQIFEQALPIVDRLYITLIKGDFGADTFFPEYSAFSKEISREHVDVAEYSYDFLILERKEVV